MPISKNRIKLIHSLEQKKNRMEEGLFLAEGPKLVGDLLRHFSCAYLAATASWFDQHQQSKQLAAEWDEATQDDLTRASLLKTPQNVLALFHIPDERKTDHTIVNHELCLALDGIQDPGNLGTIIRLADWFGIEHIFCSHETADAFSPKVVQATMGAIARVNIHYLSLPQFIQSLPIGTPLYATLLDGQNIYEQEKDLEQRGLIIMGNEGKGITEEVRRLVNHKLYIPSYPVNRSTSESLNVAIATAIVCAEFRRKEQ